MLRPFKMADDVNLGEGEVQIRDSFVGLPARYNQFFGDFLTDQNE